MAIIKGTSKDDELKGTSSADSIYGYAGNDTIYGSKGIDTMYGGKGNDVYEVFNSKDIIKENAGEGTDSVFASVSYTLGNNIENLWLKGYSKINATGNSLNNHIYGNDADNIIDGKAGADTMEGGDGNDTYYVDNKGDVIAEWIDGGNDTVISSISYKLQPVVIENLTLAGGSNLNGYGNELNNLIKGNYADNYLYGDAGNDTIAGGSGNDTIDGGIGNDSILGGDGNDFINGGTGIDTIYGGKGNDTYEVFDSKDIIKENAGEGTDSVVATVSYTLENNIENLWLKGYSKINATGNSLNNHIYGNDTDNIIDGKAGADTMEGGDGNDTYYVDNKGDIVSGEWIDGGNDTVISSISYKLQPVVIENLTLAGGSNLNGYGNELDNLINGNYANNYLYGYAGNDTIAAGSGNDTINGGIGNDSLLGGAGNDQYQFNVGDGKDTISDLSGTDSILINVSKKDATFSYKGNDLIIDYGKLASITGNNNSDSITIKNQKIATNAIERIVFADNQFITSSEINKVVQSMASFSSGQDIQTTSISSTQNNTATTNLVASPLQS